MALTDGLYQGYVYCKRENFGKHGANFSVGCWVEKKLETFSSYVSQGTQLCNVFLLLAIV